MSNLRNTIWLPIAAAGMLPGLASAGYYFETTTSTESGRSTDTSTVHAWVDGENGKIEFQDADKSGMFEAGSYMLTTDGGDTLFIVDDDKRTISEIDFAQLFQLIGDLSEASGGVVEFSFKDFSNERLLEEPGDTILGYPTTHYKFKTGYTMSFGVFGFTRDNRAENDQDVYCTDALNSGGFSAWLRPDRFRTGNEEMDAAIRSSFSDLNCLPLRTRTASTMTSGRREQTSVSTMEVTVLREESIPAATFELPADYERISLADSIAELELPTSEAPDAAEPEEEGRRPRLRDLLRR
jgi:hypothetical protein